MSIYPQLTEIFRDTLDEPDLVLTPELSARDVDTWDSLSHIRLIVAIEQEFRIKFGTREIDGLNNVGELAALIETKLGTPTR
jgi:acyl carrier protein